VGVGLGMVGGQGAQVRMVFPVARWVGVFVCAQGAESPPARWGRWCGGYGCWEDSWRTPGWVGMERTGLAREKVPGSSGNFRWCVLVIAGNVCPLREELLAYANVCWR
jgi:hypothetical protein